MTSRIIHTGPQRLAEFRKKEKETSFWLFWTEPKILVQRGEIYILDICNPDVDASVPISWDKGLDIGLRAKQDMEVSEGPFCQEKIGNIVPR